MKPKGERGALAFAMADSAAASPAPSPAKVKERSRDQLLKLLESSARKLKQFDKKYGESKKKVADLVARSQKLEEENAKLQAALDGGGAAAAEAQRSVEEKDDAIRVLSNELTGLQHEHGEKLRAKVEEVLAAEGERDEERRRVDELLVKVSDLEGQLVAAKPTEGDGERTELVERCRALEDRCGKLSESEKHATDELKRPAEDAGGGEALELPRVPGQGAPGTSAKGSLAGRRRRRPLRRTCGQRWRRPRGRATGCRGGCRSPRRGCRRRSLPRRARRHPPRWSRAMPKRRTP